jgi:hypothetical protein
VHYQRRSAYLPIAIPVSVAGEIDASSGAAASRAFSSYAFAVSCSSKVSKMLEGSGASVSYRALGAEADDFIGLDRAATKTLPK